MAGHIGDKTFISPGKSPTLRSATSGLGTRSRHPAITALEESDHWLSFKCTPDDFAELVERVGIVPASYLARAHWVALETEDALPHVEIKRLLAKARDTVAKSPGRARLPARGGDAGVE